MADVNLNGTLRHAQADKLLEAAARTKVRRYREAYATRPGVSYAFLPCVMSTSGRIHGEFLRFLLVSPSANLRLIFASGFHLPQVFICLKLSFAYDQ